MEPPQQQQSICLDFQTEDFYIDCIKHPLLFRKQLTDAHALHPELFPDSFSLGFLLHDSRWSKKQQLFLRRIKLKSSGHCYLIRPSFLMPYMVARTDDVEKALYLRHWGVSFDGLAYVFGKDPMFWYRLYLAQGRPSLVGTTVKSPEALPEHLVADEKHTRLLGEPVYITTTAANGCLLGAAISPSTSGPDLEAGYKEFADEARELNPKYQPQTVCTDGWDATHAAWRSLFPLVCLILCYLHSVLKIKEFCLRNKELRAVLVEKAWGAYAAVNPSQFSQRLRRLKEWVCKNVEAGIVQEKVLSLCRKAPLFVLAYRYPGAHRTSNEVDRLMNHQDRLLYAMRYFHGKKESARLAVRGMALLWNFHPYGARQRRETPGRKSPFHDLNGFEYHKNWLHNLLIASSMGGRRRT